MNNAAHCNKLANFTNSTVIQSWMNQPNASDVIVAQVTELIGECPAVCDTVYGNGNPDMSGIGVFISFMVQAAYFVLYRPVLGIIFLLIPQRHLTARAKLNLKRVKNLSEAIHGTSIFLTFSTLVAGSVRIKQSPPEYEVIFLFRLSRYLFHLGQSSFIVSCSFACGPTRSRYDRWYDLLEFINTILANYVNTAASRLPPNVMLWKFVSLICAKDHHFPAPTSSNQPVMLSWPVYPAVHITLFVALFIGGILLALFFSWNKWKIYVLVGRIFKDGTVRMMFFGAYNLLVITLTIHNAYELYDIRSKMLALDPVADSDNEWSFGQVTAVLLWVPITLWMVRNLLRLLPWLDILAWIIKCLRPPRQDQANPDDDESQGWTLSDSYTFGTTFAAIMINVYLDSVDPCHAEESKDKERASPPPPSDEEQASQSRDEIRDVTMSGALADRSRNGEGENTDAEIDAEHVHGGDSSVTNSYPLRTLPPSSLQRRQLTRRATG
ncbi:hypothetical protein NA57DRAFT_79039 [Rhizodiscina lignyota]|uniref:Uncharacterized protein n=1 Tax=Rhizodiscina lignyota TaxID=1504668 RepID=A0A9P4ICZ5_9PEZI|nr:hypothetical protein NA57DRAFT_79039 [Rhizodiscina lignyota]